jgi:site-specific recombinase XerD
MLQLPLKLLVDKKSVRKNGTCIVYLQYCYSATHRTLLNTTIEIPPGCWDNKKGEIAKELPPQYGQATELNDRLKNMYRIAEDLIIIAERKKVSHPGEFVKKEFKPQLDSAQLQKIEKDIEKKDNKANLDLYFQIDDYIASKVKKVCKDMPRIYRNMKDHLMEFEKFRGTPITFENLDLSFYEDFVDFLTYDYQLKHRKSKIIGLKQNTVGKTIKQFRTFLRNRIRKRIIPELDMNGWTILEEEVDAVYLTTAEINKIYSLNLSDHPELTNHRNDFIVGCLTGLRFSDFSKISATDIRGDLLFKKQEKSDRWVVIPLRTEAKKILIERCYKNTTPPTNAEFNQAIKTISRLAGIDEKIKHSYKKGNKDIVTIKPKHEWITSHTCRRSFCTNEFLAGTPVELIMKISGHKSVKDFYKYIRITPEEAAGKIKKIWESRGEIYFQ